MAASRERERLRTFRLWMVVGNLERLAWRQDNERHCIYGRFMDMLNILIRLRGRDESGNLRHIHVNF